MVLIFQARVFTKVIFLMWLARMAGVKLANEA